MARMALGMIIMVARRVAQHCMAPSAALATPAMEPRQPAASVPWSLADLITLAGSISVYIVFMAAQQAGRRTIRR